MRTFTSWVYSNQTEAERIIETAHYLATGFFRINNFFILPKYINSQNIYSIVFPDLNYKSIKRFWEKAIRSKVNSYPIKTTDSLIKDVSNLLIKSNIKRPEFDELKSKWAKAEEKIIDAIYKLIPSTVGTIKKIIIHPTLFGTPMSFGWIDNKGVIVIYIRGDQGVAKIVEAIVTAITRKDIYENMGGNWFESEMVSDWIVKKSLLAELIKIYDNNFFLPTIKSIRSVQHADLLMKTEDFYNKLGIPLNSAKTLNLNGLNPEINKVPIAGITQQDKKVLRLLIQNREKLLTYDQIANEIYQENDNYSLYTISKIIERIRSKLEENGISGNYIQTLRGKGYVLKN